MKSLKVFIALSTLALSLNSIAATDNSIKSSKKLIRCLIGKPFTLIDASLRHLSYTKSSNAALNFCEGKVTADTEKYTFSDEINQKILETAFGFTKLHFASCKGGTLSATGGLLITATAKVTAAYCTRSDYSSVILLNAGPGLGIGLGAGVYLSPIDLDTFNSTSIKHKFPISFSTTGDSTTFFIGKDEEYGNLGLGLFIPDYSFDSASGAAMGGVSIPAGISKKSASSFLNKFIEENK